MFDKNRCINILVKNQLLIWMILVWRIAKDSPYSPNVTPTKHSWYTAILLWSVVVCGKKLFP